MSRLQVLAGQPRLALGALLTLLLAAGAVVGSGADFTASSANPANTFASGTLTIGNSKEASPSSRRATCARRGRPDRHRRHREHRLAERRLHAVRGTRRPTPTATNPLSAKLNLDGRRLRHLHRRARRRPAATATTSPSTRARSPRWRTTRARHLRRRREAPLPFTVALDGTAGNAYQGDSSTVQFDFNAA